jgi:hypothetical protein
MTGCLTGGCACAPTDSGYCPRCKARRDRILASIAKHGRAAWERGPVRAAKKRAPSQWPLERQEQIQLLRWLRDNGLSALAIPGGAAPSMRDVCDACRRVVKQAAAIHWRNLKAQGYLPGAPDLVIMQLASDGCPVAVEMKRVRDADPTVSAEQRAAHAQLRAAGWHVLVGYGANDAIAQLRALGFGRGAKQTHSARGTAPAEEQRR